MKETKIILIFLYNAMVGFISSNKRIFNFYSVNVLHLNLVNGKEGSHKKLLNKMFLL